MLRKTRQSNPEMLIEFDIFEFHKFVDSKNPIEICQR